MEALRKKAREILTGGQAKVIIGYGEGSPEKARAIFVQNPEEVDQLIYDQRCRQNLAVYLMKPEVKTLGKLAITASVDAMRSILQLASENQLTDAGIVVIGVNDKGDVIEFANLQAVEEHLKTAAPKADNEVKARIEEIEKKPMAERWQYWQEQLANCFKCYACRSACPMCYCSRCTVECNQPQWIPSAAHHLGNLEWHVMRAMHLAGRCIECGECGRACPLGIPIHLLTQKIAAEIKSQFDQQAGMSLKYDNPLSSFKPDDKENFIK
ncbi:MAG: 4Fe-4S dicluster domain-containing protein [Acidobacteria bacterium]|jgi:ferredoxin|nr:4Fe-4S dicluster domain-containing protein [Acidobacteriota bacterium]